MERRTRNSTRWITASALALALPLLAACTGDTDPTQSPSATTPPSESITATPTETERDPLTPPTFETPTTEEQAAKDAKDAATAYNESQVAIEQAGKSSVLELYFGGEALTEAKQSLENIVQYDLDVQGEVSFDPNESVTVSARGTGDSAIEFGSATVTGCVDLSGYDVRQDGKQLEVPGNGKHPRLYDLSFDQESQTWLIMSTYQMEGTC